MDDTTKAWLAFLTPLAVAVSIVVQQLTAYLDRQRAVRERRFGIAKAEEVKQKLAQSTAITQDKLDDIHVLVNGNHVEALKVNAELAKRLYALTGKPEDKKALDEALAKLGGKRWSVKGLQ